MSIFNLYTHSVYEHVNVRGKNMNISPVGKTIRQTMTESFAKQQLLMKRVMLGWYLIET